MKPSAHPAYRPDIDGLRAVAVLSVVGFHAFPGWFPGGFVGVDVFFVISGYLISKIIIGNLDRGTFSVAEFYARRVRRIFPALGTVLAACMVAGWFVLLPSELAQLGKHIAGGAGFVANLVLLNESGYFDSTAATKPLLHLWSLGIEEQFYLVWPVVLYMARKRRIALALSVIFALSFGLNLLLLPAHHEATFYSPITRFWELLVGGALAYVALRRPRWLDAPAGSHGIRSLIGLVMIGVAVWTLDAEQPFPGWRATLPVAGACLLISAGPHALLNRSLLSQPALVWVGLISFPLYLWHWPLLAFARIVEAATPAPKVRIVAVLASFVLAWLTYRFVETPIRVGRQRRRTVPILLASLGALLVLGLVLAKADGFARARGPWNVANISDEYTQADQFNRACLATESDLFTPRFEPALDYCHATAGPQRLDVVVVGDSHAGRIYSGLREATDLTALVLGRSSCLPLIGYEASDPGSGIFFMCSPTMAHLLERAVTFAPKTVILSGFFARPYDGRVVSRSKEPLPTLMRDTLQRIASNTSQVVVVLDVPELPFDPSYCVDRPFRRGAGRGRCAFGKAEPDRLLALYAGDLRTAAAGLQNVSFFDPAEVLCEGASCYAVKNQHLLYDDRHHLSRYGAALVAKALESRLR